MKGKYLAIVGFSAGLVALAYLQFARQETVSPQDAAKTEPTATQAADASPSLQADTTLKNGIYEVVGEYTSPKGPETIGVKITLERGVITASEVTVQAVNETSKRMQGKFKDAYQTEVIGKPISSLDLGVVGGSSLTPNGFEDALKKIVEQAQS